MQKQEVIRASGYLAEYPSHGGIISFIDILTDMLTLLLDVLSKPHFGRVHVVCLHFLTSFLRYVKCNLPHMLFMLLL